MEQHTHARAATAAIQKLLVIENGNIATVSSGGQQQHSLLHTPFKDEVVFFHIFPNVDMHAAAMSAGKRPPPLRFVNETRKHQLNLASLKNEREQRAPQLSSGRNCR